MSVAVSDFLINRLGNHAGTPPPPIRAHRCTHHVALLHAHVPGASENNTRTCRQRRHTFTSA
jgi:hypothetical protein